MIEKVAKKKRLADSSQIKEDLVYWLKRSPAERVAAVDYLRRQVHGNSGRLQRVAPVVKRA